MPEKMQTYNDARLVRTRSAADHLFYLRDTLAGAIMASVRVDSYADERAAAEAADRIAARWNAVADALATLDDDELNGPTARDVAAAILRKALT